MSSFRERIVIIVCEMKKNSDDHFWKDVSLAVKAVVKIQSVGNFMDF
jgi:hypothetical protein